MILLFPFDFYKAEYYVDQLFSFTPKQTGVAVAKRAAVRTKTVFISVRKVTPKTKNTPKKRTRNAALHKKIKWQMGQSSPVQWWSISSNEE